MEAPEAAVRNGMKSIKILDRRLERQLRRHHRLRHLVLTDDTIIIITTTITIINAEVLHRNINKVMRMPFRNL